MLIHAVHALDKFIEIFHEFHVHPVSCRPHGTLDIILREGRIRLLIGNIGNEIFSADRRGIEHRAGLFIRDIELISHGKASLVLTDPLIDILRNRFLKKDRDRPGDSHSEGNDHDHGKDQKDIFLRSEDEKTDQKKRHRNQEKDKGHKSPSLPLISKITVFAF